MLSIGFSNPVYAKGLPIIGSVFEFIEEKLNFSGRYSSYSADICEMQESSGIRVTISEIYSDGMNLFVSYVLESDAPYSDYMEEDYFRKQVDVRSFAVIDDGENIYNLDDFGVAGLEGEFIDDYTFVGVETYSLGGEVFPDEFEADILINQISLIQLKGHGDYMIKGYWRFKVPAKVNLTDVSVFEPSVTSEEHSIDQVIVAPVMITVMSSYPHVYVDEASFDYSIYLIYENSGLITTGYMGEYGDTKAISKFAREDITENFDLYVVNEADLRLEAEFPYTKEIIE